GKENLWKSYKGMYAPSSMEMIVQPSSYKIFTLDNAAMKLWLSDVTSNENTTKTVTIPTPEGGYRTFRIWKNSAMAPGLAEKYPEIQTFDGVDVDDPGITAKFGFNMFGFNAF